MPLVSPELTAVVRHLSGRRRGRAEAVEDRVLEVAVGVDGEACIRPPDPADGADCAVRLHRAGPTYVLEAAAGSEILVNGELVPGNRLLGSGDLIEFGYGGPLLRLRLYPPDAIPAITLSEVFSDSMAGARFDSRSRIGQTGSFVARFVQDLATRTAAAFRASVLSQT